MVIVFIVKIENFLEYKKSISNQRSERMLEDIEYFLYRFEFAASLSQIWTKFVLAHLNLFLVRFHPKHGRDNRKTLITKLLSFQVTNKPNHFIISWNDTFAQFLNSPNKILYITVQPINLFGQILRDLLKGLLKLILVNELELILFILIIIQLFNWFLNQSQQISKQFDHFNQLHFRLV